MDHAEDRLLDQLRVELDRLLGAHPDAVVAEVTVLVRRLLLAEGPDGTWADDALLHEALRAVVEVVEARLGRTDLAPDVQRFLDACREAVRSEEGFADLLDALRSGVERRPAPPVRAW